MSIGQIIREHIEWKSQIFTLAKSDLIKTYSGAALGWSWAIIKPTVTIFVFWFAFSSGLRDRAGIEVSVIVMVLPGRHMRMPAKQNISRLQGRQAHRVEKMPVCRED